MNKNCGDIALLKRFLDEQLSAEEESWVCEHVGDCQRCRGKLDTLMGVHVGEDVLRKNLAGFDPTSNAWYEDPSLPTVPENSLDSVTSLLAPTDNPAMLGRLGKYEICGLVGQGSSGMVFKAHDPTLNRYVAIKMLMPGYSSNGMARKRFEREGRAIGAVRNAHVIQVHGVDEFHGTPYIVMQYVPAGSLQKRLDESGSLSTLEVCRIGLQIAWGLEAAHQQGIIHRDIKPANILLEEGLDHAIVSDFGLARVTDEATMTHTGSIAGTPQYMSPEQARGASLDPRTDLFSLGSVLYAACTGRSPFRGETLMGVVHQVCEVRPLQIRELNPEIAEWLEAFIFKLLSKHKVDRFDSATQVAKLLAEELSHLQMPTTVPQPERAWLDKQPRKWLSRVHLSFGLIACLLVASVWMAVTGVHPFSGQEGGPESEQTATGPKANDYGIEPTQAEQTFYKAKAAYDLAYETHLSEAALSGDMRQSIDRHVKAIELGYDKAQSNYLLSRAYAIQADTELVVKYLNRAIAAGFYDVQGLQSEGDFNRLRTDPEFVAVVNRVRSLANQRAKMDKLYFYDQDFAAAETLYRNWLESCPEDDLAITLLGASLSEQGKTREARVWNERARQTVRFAKFGNYNQGCVALMEGNVDRAFAFLNYAVETGFTDAEHLENDHMLLGLHDDPRFQNLLDRLRTGPRSKPKTTEESLF